MLTIPTKLLDWLDWGYTPFPDKPIKGDDFPNEKALEYPQASFAKSPCSAPSGGAKGIMDVRAGGKAWRQKTMGNPWESGDFSWEFLGDFQHSW